MLTLHPTEIMEVFLALYALVLTTLLYLHIFYLQWVSGPYLPYFSRRTKLMDTKCTLITLLQLAIKFAQCAIYLCLVHTDKFASAHYK